MSDVPFSKVVPSDALASPEQSRTDIPGTLRYHARTATVGHPRIRHVKVRNHDVLLTRLPGGEPVAFAPSCPHQGTDLVDATIFEGKLRCPKHQYLYDPKTGENIFPTHDARPEALCKLRPGYLRTYRVEEHDGWVWIAASPNPPPPGYDPVAELRPSRRPSLPKPTPVQRPPGSEQELKTMEHLPERLELKAGAKFEIELPTTALPGHVWLFEIQPPCVKILGQFFDEERSAHRLEIVALEPGRAVLRCTYSKPWGSDLREARSYEIQVRPPGR